MTAGAPWSVKGIDPKAREVAKDHARRSGMTLGEWLNRVILEDDGGELEPVEPPAYAAPEPPRAFIEAPPPRPRLVAETSAPRNEELARIVHALDRLTDRLEASETRTGLAISGVEHTVRQAVARIDAAERESLAVAARFETAVDHVGGEHSRLAERLRRFESEAAGPRSTEALRAIEQSVGRVAGQVYEAEGRTREGLAALEGRLARAEARLTDPATFMDEIVHRLGERLATAETHTAEALDTLRRAFAALDVRLGALEGGQGQEGRRFEALAQTLGEQVEAARLQMSKRLRAVDDGRVDRRFAELSAEVKASEQRSAQAIQNMGREVLSMADAVNRRLQTAEDRSAQAIINIGAEMSRVAGAVETRLGRVEETQAEALDRLSDELGKITERFSERLLVSERRSAEAIDDVGEQVARVTERMTQSQERAAQELGERIRESEARTARLLEETGARLEQRLDQRLGERPATAAEATLEPEPELELEPEAAPAFVAKFAPAPAPPSEPPPAPSAAAFGPELFSRAEDADEDELDLTETMPPAPRAFAPRFNFSVTDEFAPIPEPEEDLFGLDQPEPPADAEVRPALSTREVIEQARAAARAAAPERAERMSVKAKASWRAGKPAPFGATLFGMRPRRAPSSTLQTAILVAGGAAFLSVGAAGVVLVQGPQDRPAAEVASADDVQPARAAVALSPQTFAPQALSSQPVEPVAADAAAGPRPPAQLADALQTAFANAARGVEEGEPGALAKLKAIAEAGHPPAQFYLGKLYESGDHGVKQNLGEARLWTERAAAGGDAAAMHNLALFDFHGEGGAQDLAGAARWFRAAAEQGIVDSQFNLGLLYQAGSGVPRDPVQAYTWFTIAAAGGDAQARANAQALQAELSPEQKVVADNAAQAFRTRTGARSAQTTVSARPTVSVVAAQRILGRLGYFRGAANGVGSSQLKSAVAAYQRDERLPATGQLDVATAQRLAAYSR